MKKFLFLALLAAVGCGAFDKPKIHDGKGWRILIPPYSEAKLAELRHTPAPEAPPPVVKAEEPQPAPPAQQQPMKWNPISVVLLVFVACMLLYGLIFALQRVSWRAVIHSIRRWWFLAHAHGVLDIYQPKPLQTDERIMRKEESIMRYDERIQK